MLRYLTFFFVGCWPLVVSTGCSEIPEEPADVMISGTVHGLPDGTIVDLYQEQGHTMLRIDSATLRADSFAFSLAAGDEVSRHRVRLRNVTGTPWAKLALTDQNVRLQLSDSTSKWTITGGGEAQTLLREVDLLTSDSSILDYFTGNPAHPVTLEALYDVLRFGDESLRRRAVALAETIPETARSSGYGLGVMSLLDTIPALPTGLPAPAISGELPDGTAYVYASDNKRFTLVDFWSIACAPCLKAIPELDSLHRQYAGKLEIISVNVDGGFDFWRASDHLSKMDWRNVSDGHGMLGGNYHRFGIKALPAYFLLGPRGNLLGRWEGYYPGDLRARLSPFVSGVAEGLR